MKKAKRKNNRSRELGNGQSTLEFVLVFPFLVVLVLICLQLGYIVYLNNTIEQSAREGCRVISTTNSNLEGQRVIYDICPSKLKDKINVNIVPADPEKRRVGDILEVSVFIEDISLFNLIRKITGLKPLLRSRSLMRMECN